MLPEPANTLWQIFMIVAAPIILAFMYDYLRYRPSNAAAKVKQVEFATQEITERQKSNAYVGGLRNKHRNSLGVLIDCLNQGFDLQKPFLENDGWPLLGDNTNDRGEAADVWHQYNEYVVQVRTELENYTALVNYWPLGFRRLRRLRNLCIQLERTFGALDNAFQMGIAETRVINGDKKIYLVDGLEDSVEGRELREEYERLYNCWQRWHRKYPPLKAKPAIESAEYLRALQNLTKYEFEPIKCDFEKLDMALAILAGTEGGIKERLSSAYSEGWQRAAIFHLTDELQQYYDEITAKLRTIDTITEAEAYSLAGEMRNFVDMLNEDRLRQTTR